jgi:membrane protease YdiL (CAAX protease family)
LINVRVTLDSLVDRAMLGARALGFVFLIYFVPVLLRDVLGAVLPGDGIFALFSPEPSPLGIGLAISAGTTLLSLVFVWVHSRLGHGAREPRTLIRADHAFGRDWIVGFALGALSCGVVFGGLVASGMIRVSGISTNFHVGGALVAGAILLLESLREELGFRGPAQRDLGRAIGFPLSAVFLAGSFALVHRANPAFTPLGLLGVFLAGLFLAGVVRRRGDLALASGWHGGWNVFVGLVWSIPLSGYRLGGALLETTSDGDSTWTGGRFGIEGSWPGIALFVVLGFLSWRRSGASDSSARAVASPEPADDAVAEDARADDAATEDARADA